MIQHENSNGFLIIFSNDFWFAVEFLDRQGHGRHVLTELCRKSPLILAEHHLQKRGM
jgi:hypothetical protein